MSVPAQVSSTSSRCAAIARISTGIESSLDIPTAFYRLLPPSTALFISQRFHRIHLARPIGRIQAEDQPDRNTHCRGHDRTPERHSRTQSYRPLQDLTNSESNQDPQQAAHQRKGRRLDQELPENL